ncbi:UDP-N-acetylmuramate dehydrogenase [Candidatus Parcubacteria bacterium]|nr:UDP-N-acetylmuramate dehydrogenase [Candidatus Parcubacteria bacterium]
MALTVEKNVSLAQYTTLHVGGVADYFYRLTDEGELPALVHFAKEKKVPITVLGGGSNVLIADGQLARLVLKNELRGKKVEVDANGVVQYTVAAGEAWDDFVLETVEKGLTGLENLSGIPGTIGAAPIQNINAYGAEVGAAIASVRVFDTETMTFRELTKEACQFAYRESVFKTSAGAHCIVTAVTFILTPAGTTDLSYRSASQSIQKYLQEQHITTPSVSDIRNAILHVRGNIGMLRGQYCSAGSFFKNTIISATDFTHVEAIVETRFLEQHKKFSPWYWALPDGRVKISTAFLMECTPYNKHTYGKNRWRGVVGLSPLHSLSIVTEVGATANDVDAFVQEIIFSVKNIFSLTIETEVNFIS